MNLTDEEIRTKVHKALGWTERMEGPTHYAWSRGDYWHYLHEAPNYPADLNACAEFEKTLTDEEWPEYTIRLSGEEMGEGWPTCFLNLEAVKIVASATARQRCLAYLKTKGIIP